MEPDILASLDPRLFGRRLQEARKARGLTQEKAAREIGAVRTTLVAIEKGERRIRPDELVRLAATYGRSVSELLRASEPVEAFAVQLRAALGPATLIDGRAQDEVGRAVLEFERLCEDYLALERLNESTLRRIYPVPYELGGIDPEQAGEDVAIAERNRLGLGDGPLLNLRDILENDVGLRIFALELPSRIAGMFTYTEQLGGCIALNRKHPPERRRMSLAHELAHFLSKRFAPEVTTLGRVQRRSDLERFADAFARAYLLPATGLRRRYTELRRSRKEGVTPADLCALAHLYFVSVEALALRLEELKLLRLGTWDRLKDAGFKVREAQALLHLPARRDDEPVVPIHYQYLAVRAYARGELTEGQFARFLRVDRLEARRIADELGRRGVVTDDGDVGTLEMDLGDAVA